MSVRDIVQSAAGASGNGWDISTAEFAGTPVNWFYVGIQEGFPSGIFFKPDGTKMYVAGASNDSVHEYNLSTSWDISTLSYLQSFSVAAQETNPSGVFFKSDGTKMYVVGTTGDDVNEYMLSTAWDVSTASYSQNFSVSAQDTAPSDISFNSDGTKMYILGDANNNVNEYTLSTAWNISTASYVQNFSVTSQETNPLGLFFKPDGTKMYVAGSGGADINEYSLSTAWDISTATYIQNHSVISQSNAPTSLFFKSDGTKMYVAEYVYDKIYQYDLSTDWDVSTASYTYPTAGYFSVFAQETNPTSLFFKSDGTKMYVVGNATDTVYQYDLYTAWDISTASYASKSFSVAAQEASPNGLFFKPDGTSMYVIGNSSDYVNEYNLSSAWDISTASYVQNFSVAAQETVPLGVFFKPDGTKMYVIGLNGVDVNEYSISTDWDISTASYVQNFSVSSEDTSPQDVFFNPDGTKMYVIGVGFDSIYEYDLSTAWNISTASYIQNFSVEAQETNPTGLFFKDDGLKFWICGSSTDAIFEYNMG